MKIGFCGTMSVGKTTLVNSLKELDIFKEYQFRTERSKHLNNLGVPLNTDSTLKGQTIFLSERCAELIQPKIITDRTIIDVIAFTKSAKSINNIEKEKFVNYAAHFLPEYDYIFYVSPLGIDIEDNGVRETDRAYRELIDFSIKNLLNYYDHKIQNLICIPPYLSNQERVELVEKYFLNKL